MNFTSRHVTQPPAKQALIIIRDKNRRGIAGYICIDRLLMDIGMDIATSKRNL